MAQPVVLRTVSPLSLDDHGFCHIRLSSLTSPSSNSSSPSSSPSSSSSPSCCSSVHSTPAEYSHHASLRPASLQHPLDSVCLRVSREMCRCLAINSRSFSVFPYDNNNTVSVVFPEEHRDEVLCRLQSLCPSLQMKTDFQEDDTLGPGLLMCKALESSLKSHLICEGWMILESNMFIYGRASQILEDIPVEAVTIAIETGPYDKIDFLLCPDIVKFRPFEVAFRLQPITLLQWLQNGVPLQKLHVIRQVAKVLPQVLKRSYDGGCEVILDQYMQNLPEEGILELKCMVLPVMREGFVSGCCKSAPQGFSVDETWQEKYGLVLSDDASYIQVSFLSEEHVSAIWFPACLVLRRPGIIPATPAVRKDRLHSVLERIISRILGWSFFNAGVLRLEKNCAQTALSLQKVPCWSSAKTTAMQKSAGFEFEGGTSACDSYLSLLSSLETKLLHSFRRPKPLSLAPSSTDVSLPKDPSVSMSHQLNKGKDSQEGIAKKRPVLNIPSFPSRKSCKENLIRKTEASHRSINHGLPEGLQLLPIFLNELEKSAPFECLFASDTWHQHLLMLWGSDPFNHLCDGLSTFH